ncbi:MAG: glycosyltransferase [Solirubrobacteraceae bacterium]
MQSVLHLSQFDVYGGSARAATRIHENVRALGVDSRMLVGTKDGHDPDVAAIARSKSWWRADIASYAVTDRLSAQYLFTPSTFVLPLHPWFRAATVLQLYNLHGGWFAHTVLPLITRNKPAVWRLSDMWPVTGHCAYSFGCDRWQTGCGSCPHLDTYPRLRRDTTLFNWRVKRSAYGRSDLTIVAPSAWLADIAKRSPLLGRFAVHVIPTSVDTAVFRPAAREQARLRLGLPADGPVVLAVSREPRKGAATIYETLVRSRVRGVTLLLVGEPLTELGPPPDGVRLIDLGLVDTETMAATYAAADVLLLGSSADNLPNALLESMACGTPAVTAASGGIPEAVTHLVDGYVADTAGAGPLGAGLKLLLEDAELRAKLGRTAATRVRAERSVEAEARSYLELYEALA